MIIISDATAINHLGQSELIFVIPELLGKVIVPVAVFAELQAPRTPDKVRQLIASKPDWLEVRTANVIVDHELD